jgi:hypothetical protein
VQGRYGRGGGIRLKLLRVRAGVRLTRLVHETGISVAQLGAWEDGRQPVPPLHHRRLVDALDRLTLGGVERADSSDG